MDLRAGALRLGEAGNHQPVKRWWPRSRGDLILREERAKLGIDTSSSVNLFVTDGKQIAAVRYCFDFGRYATADPARLHEANLGFLSLWYTAGRDYGPHQDDSQRTGGRESRYAIIDRLRAFQSATSRPEWKSPT